MTDSKKRLAMTTKFAVSAICATAMLIGGVGCTTGGVAGGGAAVTVTVHYVNPQNFTDFRIQGRDVQSSTSIFTREVTQALDPVMRSRFPGNLLTLNFTNIDLAGRGSTGARSVRVVRTRTPARLSFAYLLQTRSGTSLATGSRTLVDTSRLAPSRPSSSGPVSAETAMLQRWLQGLSVTR